MPSKRLVVFCDGTWIGRETTLPNAPASTIRQLANQVGIVHFPERSPQRASIVNPIVPYNPNVTAGYQEGTGLNRSFSEYLWDGATAASIDKECISLYKFIVQHYTEDHEVFLYGFSRGAFTVRCVGGMINNCGIMRGDATQSEEELNELCREVYRTYRSPLAIDHPKSDRCQKFRSNAASVWQTKQPIRFMGLIDTVGALGVPRFNAGVGLDYAEFEFHDQKVSSAVQFVYQALSLHERYWALQPCLVIPGDGESKAKVRQMWFPGVHRDLGRQTFRYLRKRPWNAVERLLGAIPSALTKEEWPNEVCADAVARWLLQGTKEVETPDDANLVFPSIDEEMRKLSLRISSPDPRTLGSGDTSSAFSATDAPASNSPSSAPLTDVLRRLASMPFALLECMFPRSGKNIWDGTVIGVILGILTATKDRRIPRATDEEGVYPYLEEETVIDYWGGETKFTVGERAALQREEGRYVSQSYETFLARRRVFGW